MNDFNIELKYPKCPLFVFPLYKLLVSMQLFIEEMLTTLLVQLISTKQHRFVLHHPVDTS